MSRPPLDSPIEMPSIPARWESQIENLDLNDATNMNTVSTISVNSTSEPIPMIQFNQNDVFDEELQTKRVDPWDN